MPEEISFLDNYPLLGGIAVFSIIMVPLLIKLLKAWRAKVQEPIDPAQINIIENNTIEIKAILDNRKQDNPVKNNRRAKK